ncbi:MAG TPA: hypothetical protein VJK30_02285 [Coxiellaceae bacterium]|nr:hypothetical protein [Coxiellaceae bacterium]
MPKTTCDPAPNLVKDKRRLSSTYLFFEELKRRHQISQYYRKEEERLGVCVSQK